MWVTRHLSCSFIHLFIATLWESEVSASGKPNWPDPSRLPNTTEPGQYGYNRCGKHSSQDSNCQTLYVNSLNDFCLWAPPSGQQEVGNSEEYEVAWCTKPGRGTRQIPAGALISAHFLSTPHYVQITGFIDGPALNIKKKDDGGELDPHGATGLGNPIGSLVYTTAFGGGVQQVKEWMNFMADGEFCFRICKPGDPQAWLYCQHIYDVMGCVWVMPGNYNQTGFDSCEGDSAPPPGVYGTSTFHQGDAKTPIPHRAAKSSNCHAVQTISLLPVKSNATVVPAKNRTLTTTAHPGNITASPNTLIPGPASPNTLSPGPASPSTLSQGTASPNTTSPGTASPNPASQPANSAGRSFRNAYCITIVAVLFSTALL
ncbi:uncharacterized protein MELLADRAFT_94094 [Melampsora larici-populina 98AG31]|uniref:Secreted protein n=1 Tax=Melampsora larici-populina (strain 98AG31 / pathotype 3-4-7) TaxID=747676 RepID=F4S6D7_MELLP|nr:uncharacterized protein MELLADRAFT_94094 [Melampsora larici-populina 98AG31]EGF99813.1 hypothetical protein MELLADRAFT_94094 [Melampsora larici-populina 98AG31]